MCAQHYPKMPIAKALFFCQVRCSGLSDQKSYKGDTYAKILESNLDTS